MEMFGIIVAIPAAFIAAAIWARLMRVVLGYWLINRIALWRSTAVLGGLLLEWGALLARGAASGGFSQCQHWRTWCDQNMTAVLAGFPVALPCSALGLPSCSRSADWARRCTDSTAQVGPYGQAPTAPMPTWW